MGIKSEINLKLLGMPKQKTNSSAKKRFKLTGTGKIKRKHAFKSHILTKKSKKRKLALTHDTLSMADEQGLDLVEISPNAKPPVCKIMDYKKFLYEQKKREKALKAKASKVVVKEIRFGPQTDDHDFNFKL